MSAEKEEQIDHLLHHLREAGRIINSLNWRGRERDHIEAMKDKAQKALRIAWAAQNTRPQ